MNILEEIHISIGFAKTMASFIRIHSWNDYDKDMRWMCGEMRGTCRPVSSKLRQVNHALKRYYHAKVHTPRFQWDEMEASERPSDL